MADDLTLLITQPADNVALVTLNRPKFANAFDTALCRQITAAFESFTADGLSTRCVVITGVGSKAFCAGADLKERDGMSDAAWRAQHEGIERMTRSILNCPIPVIAAVNGAAYGGGCEIALACDFVHAVKSARFALSEVTLGIMPGAGGTQTLSRAIGTRRALEMLLTGLPASAEDAFRSGIVNALCEGDVVASAVDTAVRIAANAPLAVREIKAAVHAGAALPLAGAMARELQGYERLVPTADRLEGVRAFAEKRPARFIGR